MSAGLVYNIVNDVCEGCGLEGPTDYCPECNMMLCDECLFNHACKGWL